MRPNIGDFLAVLALGTMAATSAIADDQSFPPAQSSICGPDHIVDKDKLATYLITKFPVSVLAYTPSGNPAIASLSISRQILVSDELEDPAKCAQCTTADRSNLNAIRGYMDGVLAGLQSDAYLPTAAVDPNIYFLGLNSANAICCVLVNGKPVESPGAKFNAPVSGSNIRVRGNSSDLYIDQSAKSDFAAASKATVSLTQDNVARKDTYQITADIGYYIPLTPGNWSAGDRVELIPYVGTNWNFVTTPKGSMSKPSVGTETIDAGFLFDAYLISNRDFDAGRKSFDGPAGLSDEQRRRQPNCERHSCVHTRHKQCREFLPTARGGARRPRFI